MHVSSQYREGDRLVFGPQQETFLHWTNAECVTVTREFVRDPFATTVAGPEDGTLAELRGTDHQTLAPSYTHPSGEIVT